MRAWAIILAMLTAMILPACAPSPPLEQVLVGKWEEQVGGSREVLEFAADGKASTYYLEDGSRKAEMVGTYSVVDGEQVRIEFQGQEKQGRVRVTRDELILWLPPGKEGVRYRRVR